MSTLKADTIVATDGSSPVTLTKQAAAKAWLNLTTETSNTVNDSFNNSSNTDNANGDFSISFSNSFANAYYSVSGTSAPGSSTNPYTLAPDRIGSNGNREAPTSSGQRLNTQVANGADDSETAYITHHGDLA